MLFQATWYIMIYYDALCKSCFSLIIIHYSLSELFAHINKMILFEIFNPILYIKSKNRLNMKYKDKITLDHIAGKWPTQYTSNIRNMQCKWNIIVKMIHVENMIIFQMSTEDMVPWSACFSSHEFNLICPTVSLLCCWQLLIARFHLNFTYCSLLITFNCL